jgi:sn-glycerol 3-phosphate transport system permease protein
MTHARFRFSLWPYLFIAPQLLITLIFFIWPAISALCSAFSTENSFGLHRHFVWFKNFIALFESHSYSKAFIITAIFCVAVTILAQALGLLFATLTERTTKLKKAYRTFYILPYAVAPAVAGIVFRFLFDPAVGIIPYWLHDFGIIWNAKTHPGQALCLIIFVAAWQQLSYNFLFYLAALQSVPKSLIEAAALDGAGPFKRFWTIVFPMLSPTTFFLIVMNGLYALFDTFGIIQVVTQGGPANGTQTLVYKVYKDGFMNLDFSSSATQSVILMLIVAVLTITQFRLIGKKVHYQ